MSEKRRFLNTPAAPMIGRSLTEQAGSGTKTLQGIPGPRRIPSHGELPEV